MGAQNDRVAPVIVAIDMGYGHLRAAEPLAEAFGTQVLCADRPPIGDGTDERVWARTRRMYERASRLCALPVVGAAARTALEAVTSIPPLETGETSTASLAGVRLLTRMIDRGLGAALTDYLHRTNRTLVTTFYAPAIEAARAGLERIVCVVTDSDINRVWAAEDSARSCIVYAVPSARARERLISYGVRADRISHTGFPLPDELVGGSSLGVLRRNLARRLVRLDPARAFLRSESKGIEAELGVLGDPRHEPPPLLTFAVGGAGAQTRTVRDFLPSLRAPIAAGRLRLALVAGVRLDVAKRFEYLIEDAGLEPVLGQGVRILVKTDWKAYYGAFNALLAETDILWTKPSEMVFYAALGLPEILSPPIGVHEHRNRDWLIAAGAAVEQANPRTAGQWLTSAIDDGTLAAAAWSGFKSLPKLGTDQIRTLVNRLR